jgi:hypothetical protein
MKFASIIAALAAVLTTPAAAQPLDRPTLSEPRDPYRSASSRPA